MKVLIAGIHYFPNQFSRAVQNYGVEVVHMPKKDYFPTDCEAVILCKAQMGHDFFWAAKEAFSNRSVFIAHAGFSSIKERFEAFLKEKGKLKPFNPVVVADADEQPLVTTTTTEEQEPSVSAATRKNYERMDPEEMSRAKKIIHECINSSFSREEVLEMLKSEGIKKPGLPMSVAWISGIANLSGWHFQKKKRGTKKPAYVPQVLARAAAAAGPSASSNEMTTLKKILASQSLTPEKKIKLLELLSSEGINPEVLSMVLSLI